MPNVRISDLPPVALPLTGAELLEITQNGLSYKVTSNELQQPLGLQADFVTLSANVDLPNERILTAGGGISIVDGGPGLDVTISSTVVPGGQVNSVVGGANITVDVTDPVNPVVDLDAALLGVSVNGVTLSNLGVATNYLDETGNYSVPAGGGAVPAGADSNIQYNNGGVFGGESNFSYNDIEKGITLTHDAAPGSGRPAVAIVVNVAAPAMRFSTNQTGYSLMEVNANAGVNVGFDLDLDFTGADPDHFLRLTDQAGSFLQTWSRNGIVDISNSLLVVDTTAPAAVRISGAALLEMNERIAANAFVAGVGQFWVRDDAPNVPMFTNDVGTDFVLNTGGAVPDPLVIGSVNATSNAAINLTDNVAALNIGNTAIPGTLPLMQINSQFIQAKSSKFGIATLFLNNLGGDISLGNANFAGITIDAPASGVQVRHSTSAVAFQTDIAGMRVNLGSVYMDEKAAAGADFGARGQYWVRNDVPCVPMFTNDVGTDFVLTAGGGAQISGVPVNNQLAIWTNATDIEGVSNLTYDGVSLGVTNATFFVNDTTGPDSITISVTGGEAFINATGGTTLVNLSGAPFYINNGHLFFAETAAANADVAGRGQHWVRNDTPNNPMFTDDAGNDFGIALTPGRLTTDNSFNFNTAGNRAQNWVGSYFDGSNNTITLENAASVVNWPVGVAVQIIAPGSGVQTITEGVGVTLFLDDGVDTVGGVTVSQGVQTIFRQTAANYIIWGSGIT